MITSRVQSCMSELGDAKNSQVWSRKSAKSSRTKVGARAWSRSSEPLCPWSRRGTRLPCPSTPLGEHRNFLISNCNFFVKLVNINYTEFIRIIEESSKLDLCMASIVYSFWLEQTGCNRTVLESIYLELCKTFNYINCLVIPAGRDWM